MYLHKKLNRTITRYRHITLQKMALIGAITQEEFGNTHTDRQTNTNTHTHRGYGFYKID